MNEKAQFIVMMIWLVTVRPFETLQNTPSAL
jgi:hypothetical protein